MTESKNGVTKILEEITHFLEDNPDLLIEGGKEELMNTIIYAAVLLNRSDLLKVQEYHEKYPSLTWVYSQNKKMWNTIFIVGIIGLFTLNGIITQHSGEIIDFLLKLI